MGQFLSKVKEHFTFGINELQSLAIACVVMAFLFGFDDGKETFEFSAWFANYLIILILVVVIVFVHESAHKLWAIGAGYRSEFRLWPYGLVIALALAFISKGKFFFLGLGGVWITEMAIHRLGKFRYGLNTFASMWVAFAGPFANVILAALFKPVYVATMDPMVGLFVKMNIWYAIFSMIPIPPLDGSTGFFGGRTTYMLLLGIILGLAIMIWVATSFLVMAAGTIIFALLFWIVYFFMVEQE